MRHKIALFIFAAAFALAGAPGLAQKADRPIEDFFGTYVGRSISTIGDDLSDRDLNVTIKKHKKGFAVEWATVLRRPDGSTKSRTYSINFFKSGRPGIFKSAMRNNVFGAAMPLDPLKGDPYLWAGINGDTLTIHAMIITDTGGYEMQVYDRTLTEDGLFLKFSRNRDGAPLRFITGTLKRVKE